MTNVYWNIVIFIERLIEPHPSVHDPRERWQARYIAILLLAGSIVSILVTLLFVVASDDVIDNLRLGLPSTLLLFIAYLISRTRSYQWAGLLAVLIATSTTTLSVLLNPKDDSILIFLSLSSLAAVVMLDFRPAVGVILANILIVLLLPVLIPSWTLHTIANELGFLVAFSVEMTLVVLLRQKDVEALVAQEKIYHALFEQTNDAVFILNVEAGHIEVNQKACEMLGYSREELIGLEAKDIVAPEEHPSTQNVLKRLLEGERLPPYERIFQRKDGSFLPVELNVELVRDSYGQPLHIQSIARDLARRKTIEQQTLALMLERERARLLRDFINNISHDFKTPLTTITNSTYLLRRVHETDKRLRYLDTIEANVEHITTLVDAMITMMRLDVESDLEVRSVQINPLVSQIADRFQAAAARKALTIGLNLAEDLPPVPGDEGELVRMLDHLVSNAVQNSSPGDGYILLSTSLDNNKVVVTVQDQGEGIPPESLAHIFERFYRVDKARNQQSGGSGLGLAIIKKIVDVHHGEITVESTVGQGSIFRVSLPIEREKIKRVLG